MSVDPKQLNSRLTYPRSNRDFLKRERLRLVELQQDHRLEQADVYFLVARRESGGQRDRAMLMPPGKNTSGKSMAVPGCEIVQLLLHLQGH